MSCLYFIPRNTNASMYNAWFRAEFPELFECEIAEVAESCEECGFCEHRQPAEEDDPCKS